MKGPRGSKVDRPGAARPRAAVRRSVAGGALAGLVALGGWMLLGPQSEPAPAGPAPSRPTIDRTMPPACHAYLAAHEACLARSAGEAHAREEQALATQRRVIGDAAHHLATEDARKALAGACEQLREGLRSRCESR